MNEYIEKTRPDVAASEREREQRNTGKAFSVSGVEFTMSEKSTQGLIDFLPRSPDGAITAEQLGNLLHMDERAVTRLIQRYRLAGVPICAACGEPRGYFLAGSPEVLGRYLRSLDGRLREITRTREAMSKTLDGMTGQGRMEGF